MNLSPTFPNCVTSNILGLILLIAFVSFAGCSNPLPRRYSVQGEVTLDGVPLDGATIVFTPKAKGLAAVSSIVNGKFQFNAMTGPTTGEFHVRINPVEVEIEMIEPNGKPSIARSASPGKGHKRIPKKYQNDGELHAVVSGEDIQLLRFELRSGST